MAVLKQRPAVLNERGDFTPDAWRLIRYFANRYAFRRCLDREDLTQEAAVLALRGASQFDRERGNLSGWLHWSVRNAARTLCNANRRHAHEDLPHGQFPDRGDSPADSAEVRELQAVVQRAVDCLPAARRIEVVRRYGLDGLPPARLCELAGTASRSAVSARVVKSLRVLATELAGKVRTETIRRSGPAALSPQQTSVRV